MITPTSLPARRIISIIVLSVLALPGHAANPQRFCGKEGVWLQILGSGGAERTDQRGGAGYIVWLNDKAKLLVDLGVGSALRFEEVGAKFEDVDAIAFTSLQSDHSVDFPAFVQGASFSGRTRVLPVFGPEGSDVMPATSAFVNRLIGPQGAYPLLAQHLTRQATSYRIDVTDIPAAGTRRWARFGNADLRLAAIAVHHGSIPAVAWRVTLGAQSITFTGDFNDEGNTMAAFAKGTDALVIDHSLEEGARGAVRDEHVVPSQIGKIAAQAGARMVILSHRTNRTRSRESMTEAAIRKHYAGPLLFASDYECWGL